MSTIKSLVLLVLQDEKNEMLHTNTWLNYVSSLFVATILYHLLSYDTGNFIWQLETFFSEPFADNIGNLMSLGKSYVVYVLGRIAVLRKCDIVIDRVGCCRSVGRSVTIVSPAKNGWTDQDVVWDVDSGEPCIRWGPDPPCEGATLRGKERHIVKYMDSLPWAMQQELTCSWVGRPFGHNRHGPKIGGLCTFRGSWSHDPM